MIAWDEATLKLFSKSLSMPAYLVSETSVTPLNPEAESLSLSYSQLVFLLPLDVPVINGYPLSITIDGQPHSYLLNGKTIWIHDTRFWFIQLISVDAAISSRQIQKVAAARAIMLRIVSRIDTLKTDHDLYEFILDSCAQAIEHPSLCTLMLVENGHTRIVAKRGFLDDVLNLSFDIHDTFLSLETHGKMDRIVIVNDLEKYKGKYHTEAKTDKKDEYLLSTISTPIYVNHQLYALLNFDSTEKNTFLREDAELLYLIKSNIEIILTNHLLHEQIQKLSETDILTGLYNRTFLRQYCADHIADTFFVIAFDLNNLKTINDKHGHNNGDLFIQTFAQELPLVFSSDSYCARMGGDEFLVIAHNKTEKTIAASVEQLRLYFKKNSFLLTDNTSITLSFSCGYAFHTSRMPVAQVLQLADAAMYADKQLCKKNLHPSM